LLPIGVPVYVEKPLTDDPESARRLADTAPDRLFVMDKWRHHDGIRALAAIAHTGSSARDRPAHDARRLG
jgi:predicted dehydrogenase